MGGLGNRVSPFSRTWGQHTGGIAHSALRAVSCSRSSVQRGQGECVRLVPVLVQLRLLCVRSSTMRQHHADGSEQASAHAVGVGPAGGMVPCLLSERGTSTSHAVGVNSVAVHCCCSLTLPDRGESAPKVPAITSQRSRPQLGKRALGVSPFLVAPHWR